MTVNLFNSTNKDYVRMNVLPPNIYIKPSVFKIISADSSVNISMNELFSINDPYSNIITDIYNLTLFNMLSNMNNGYTFEWKCYSKYLQN